MGDLGSGNGEFIEKFAEAAMDELDELDVIKEELDDWIDNSEGKMIDLLHKFEKYLQLPSRTIPSCPKSMQIVFF